MPLATDLQFRDHVPLAPYTTLGLGGPARYFVDCRGEEHVRAALSFAEERGIPVMVLGGGSNVVFSDAGFPGLVLRMTEAGLEYRDAGTPEIVAGAGATWDDLVRGAVQRGWSGLECLSGIPGTVGGTPIQNIGAYGQEVAATIRSVTCLDRTTLTRRVFEGEECRFAYRTSRFKQADRGRYVVLEVGYGLQRDAQPRLQYPELRVAIEQAGSLSALGPGEALRRVRETVLALRRRKSMVVDPDDPNTRSAGSFFLNPVLSPAAFSELQARWSSSGADRIPSFPAPDGVKVPAAWLVEHSGFTKGYRRGSAGISSRHALALVNHGGTTADLLALADAITAAVYQQFGIRLEPEPEIVKASGPDAHLL